MHSYRVAGLAVVSEIELPGAIPALHFGAARGQDKPLDAHAWLDAAGVDVTGYPVAQNFAEIACFV